MLEGTPLEHCYTVLANVMAGRIVQQADRDADNQISFAEFTRWYTTLIYPSHWH
jgi:hypothetical protein